MCMLVCLYVGHNQCYYIVLCVCDTMIILLLHYSLLMTPKESLLHIGFYCTVHVLHTCLLSLGKLIRGGVGKL